MNTKELLINFVNYAKSIHVMPILDSNIETLVDVYMSDRNVSNVNVSGGFEIGKHIRIERCLYGHEFFIGEIVTIIDKDQTEAASWSCTNGQNSWWVSEDEAVCV